MADWRTQAEQAAQRAGVDPNLYAALVWQESRGKANAVSPRGALGYSQLMPDTARGLGVDPRDPAQNLYGGALYLKQQLKTFHGNVPMALAAYNAGPGAVQKYGGVPPFAETQGYVKAITGSLHGGGSSPQAGGRATPDPVSALTNPAPVTGPASNGAALIQLASQSRQAPAASGALPRPAAMAGPALPQGYQALAASQGPGPRKDISGALAAAATPGQAAANVVAQASPLVAAASSASGPAPASGGDGAAAALSWAESKVGQRETGGENVGGLASYLNQRFGMNAQPWCAMFTSVAVTKGGAPSSARTASVAEVRRQAEQGGGGYRRGFVDAGNAKAGDLILFGNDHIGMVQRVKGGKIFYVGGNQSDAVTEASVPVGGGDIVRPRYGAR